MKIFKSSKILLCSVAVASLMGLVATEETNARNYNGVPTQSIHDMMMRRNGKLHYEKVRNSDSTTATSTGKVKVISEDSTKSTVAFNPKDGSLFPGGSCESCYKSGPLIDAGPCESCNRYKSGPLIDAGPCESCKQPKPKMATTIIEYKPIIPVPNCCSMAPLYLQHVDFNINGAAEEDSLDNKLGNYRFRIFGCRRYSKEAVLNQGRIMEKDMNFNKVFEDVVGDCYNVVKLPEDLCLQKTPSPLPEYLLTAEITDVFMNVCDGYDWKETAEKNSRTGSAEMTVVWRLTNITKTEVLWKGTTTGYSDVVKGSAKGEIDLIEQAFADATSNLRHMPGFEEQLMVRLTPEQLSAQRNALIDEEVALNPTKCKFEEELNEVKQCEIYRPGADITKCPAVQTFIVTQPVIEPTVISPEIEVPQPVIIENSGIESNHAIFDNCIDEKGGVISDGNCKIVDDTWIDVKQDIQSFDSLCIVDRPPYPNLAPHNLYKVRASVVEIENANGKKGAGLILSENFVLTSADLVEKENNLYKMRTINGKNLEGQAVRINPTKNTALIMLSEPTQYTPLSLNLSLPKVGQGGFMTLGMLDVENFEDGENYIDNNGKVTGYRYSEDKGSEIMMDTFIQNMTIGGVLIDANGTINGMAHSGKKTENGMDLFLPTETAIRSVGLSICEKLYEKTSPWQQTVYKPITQKVMTTTIKAPEVMKSEDRK